MIPLLKKILFEIHWYSVWLLIKFAKTPIVLSNGWTFKLVYDLAKVDESTKAHMKIISKDDEKFDVHAVQRASGYSTRKRRDQNKIYSTGRKPLRFQFQSKGCFRSGNSHAKLATSQLPWQKFRMKALQQEILPNALDSHPEKIYARVKINEHHSLSLKYWSRQLRNQYRRPPGLPLSNYHPSMQECFKRIWRL